MPPPDISIDTVKTLLRSKLRLQADDVEVLTPGAWSRAFAFHTADGDFVIRFSDHPDDFARDAFAARFANEHLPIPRVVDQGEYAATHFAISEKVRGTFLDLLDRDAFRRALPSLLSTLDALRAADLGETTGYGGWDERGNGQHATWRAYLRASVQDSPETRGGSWRSRLQSSPIGSAQFDRDVAVFLKRVDGMPEHRHVIHADLLNFNVFTECDRISGVIDWGCAMYGDFLYELAWFAFWWPWYPSWHAEDIVAEARDSFVASGADLASFRERLSVYQVQIGLMHQAYHATTGDWDMLEAIAHRTSALANGIR